MHTCLRLVFLSRKTQEVNNLRTNLELAQQQTTISEAGDLGQTLLDRQASLEAVTAERTALALQLERLEVGTSHHKTNTIVVAVSCTYLDTCECTKFSSPLQIPNSLWKKNRLYVVEKW